MDVIEAVKDAAPSPPLSGFSVGFSVVGGSVGSLAN